MSSDCDFLNGRRSNERDADEESPASPSFSEGPFNVNLQSEGDGKSVQGLLGNSDDDISISVGSLPSFPAGAQEDITNLDSTSFTANMFCADEEGKLSEPIDEEDNVSTSGVSHLGEGVSDGNGNYNEWIDGGGKLGDGALGEAERSDGSNSSAEIQKEKRKVCGDANDEGRAKKRKAEGNKKNKKSSEVAKKRELDKFKRWLQSKPATIPVEWTDGSEPNTIEGHEGERFLQYGRRVVAEAKTLGQGQGGMKDHFAARLNDVLDNCYGKTYAEMYRLTVMCFASIQDGTRKKQYDKKHCKVCKAANVMVDQSNHDCPYCHECFAESGYKRKCIKLDECTVHNRDEAKD